MEVLNGVERTTPSPVETGADRLPRGGIGKKVAVESGLEGLGIGVEDLVVRDHKEETLDSRRTEAGGWGEAEGRRGRSGWEWGLNYWTTHFHGTKRAPELGAERRPGQGLYQVSCPWEMPGSLFWDLFLDCLLFICLR